MCYNYSLKATKREIEKQYQLQSQEALSNWEPLVYNSAFSKPKMPILTSSGIGVFNWGLIPNWSKNGVLDYNTAIARSEEVYKKKTWIESIESRRCIIPMTGFFEWRHEGKTKYPYHIYKQDSKIFSIAGIWDLWHNDKTNEKYYSFSLLTVSANDFMSKIHNIKKRMPLFLNSDDELVWLDNNAIERDVKRVIERSNKLNLGANTLKQGFSKQNSNKILDSWEYPELALIDLF